MKIFQRDYYPSLYHFTSHINFLQDMIIYYSRAGSEKDPKEKGSNILTYLIFVIFYTQANFLENKI